VRQRNLLLRRHDLGDVARIAVSKSIALACILKVYERLQSRAEQSRAEALPSAVVARCYR
jgi:hypothetical protein